MGMATALITGGTSGIGAEFARQLAARGYDLVLVARDGTRLDAMAAELSGAHGISVETLSADLFERSDVARVAARLGEQQRPIDYLVNNAGFGLHSPLLAEDVSPHDRALEVMVRSVLVLGGAAGRAMRSRGHGSIVNVSSTAGFVTMGSYSAVKAWVTSYTEGLAVELRDSGVTATALCPGWVHTEFHERAGIRTGSIPAALWMDVQPLVSGCLRDVDRGKVISIPGARWRLLIAILRHLPRSTVRWVSGRISSSRSEQSHPVGPPAPNPALGTTAPRLSGDDR